MRIRALTLAARALHIIVEAAGYQTLVTDLFDPEEAYLDSDAVFGVRQALVTAYQPQNNPADMAPGLA